MAIVLTTRACSRSVFSTPAKALLAFALLAGVAGCRESEQDRPLLYEKGEYLGQPDTQLDEAQRRELELRGLKQKF